MKSINFSFKRVAALALAALLLLSLMPALTLNARADEPQPEISGLRVGDSAEVTAKGEIAGTGATSGTASVKLENGELILTLDNFVYSGEGYKETGKHYSGESFTKQYGIYYAVPDEYSNMRIVLIGENKLSLTSIPSGKDSTTDSRSIGIFCEYDDDDFSLTICGDGSLEVSAGEAKYSCGMDIKGSLTFEGGKTTVTSGNAENSYGIKVGYNLTVKSGEITATSGVATGGGSYAIGAKENIAISGGTVIAKAGETKDTDDSSFGIYSKGLVSVTGGTVQAYGADLSVEKAPSSGIACSGFSVSGGDVTAVGGNAASSFGLFSFSEDKPIIITDGKITAKSGKAEDSSFGINSYGLVSVTGGTVQAYGADLSVEDAPSSGIMCSGFSVSGGDVTAVGGDAANSGGISTAELNISGGSVSAESGDANRTSAAISADEELIISGGNVSAITGTATYTYGIYSEKGSVAISGGVVRAEPGDCVSGGGTCAISAKKNIDFTGGEIYALSNFMGISVYDKGDENNTATVTVGSGVSYLEVEGNHGAIGGEKIVINKAGKAWGDNNGEEIEKEIAAGEYENLTFELGDGNNSAFYKVIFGSKPDEPQPQPSTNTNIPHRPVTPSTPSSSATDKQDNTDEKTVTENKADGSKTETKTNADGSKTETTTAQDGSKGEVKMNAEGETVSAAATVSEKAVEEAVKAGENVKVQVEVKAAASAEKAAPVTVTLPKTEKPVRVEIPVENVTASTVAVIVYDDGREEIVKTSTTGEDGVVLSLEGSATVKIVDNAKNFGDVKADDWFASSVAWAASHEVMNGTDKGFEPNADTSRGMIAQLLFNLDGAEATGDTAAFKDVAADDWFAGAVSWMNESGIAKGRGDSFGANDSVSREDLAVMLYNYAQHKGYDTTTQGDVSSFGDADGVSDYAKDALAWAVGVGLINGTTDKDGNIVLDAQGSATRAQVAAIMQRFCDKVAK